VATPFSLVGWPALTVTLAIRHGRLDGPLASGATVGTLHAGVGNGSEDVAVRTATTLSGPSVWWRLTR
jgi:hypothetical protein